MVLHHDKVVRATGGAQDMNRKVIQSVIAGVASCLYLLFNVERRGNAVVNPVSD